jgi:hypothetical protein
VDASRGELGAIEFERVRSAHVPRNRHRSHHPPWLPDSVTRVERRLIKSRRVFVEAAARLPPEAACADHAGKQRGRRVLRLPVLAVQRLGNRQRGVETDVVSERKGDPSPVAMEGSRAILTPSRDVVKAGCPNPRIPHVGTHSA